MMGLLGHLTPIEILGRRHTRKKGTRRPEHLVRGVSSSIGPKAEATPITRCSGNP